MDILIANNFFSNIYICKNVTKGTLNKQLACVLNISQTELVHCKWCCNVLCVWLCSVIWVSRPFDGVRKTNGRKLLWRRFSQIFSKPVISCNFWWEFMSIHTVISWQEKLKKKCDLFAPGGIFAVQFHRLHLKLLPHIYL